MTLSPEARAKAVYEETRLTFDYPDTLIAAIAIAIRQACNEKLEEVARLYESELDFDEKEIRLLKFPPPPTPKEKA